MNNRPVLKLGIVAVSRNCFPMSLSVSRREAVVKAYRETYGEIYECPTCIENEVHMQKALSEVREAGCTSFSIQIGRAHV